MPPVSLKDPQTTLVDLFGDGLPDVLNTTATGYYFWRNLGNGQLDMRHPQHTVPAGITLSQPGVAFGDMGGDGMADLIVQWPEMAGFYEATPDGSWKPFKKFDTYPSFSLTDPNARLIDLTGDGRSDILMTRDRHFLWFKCLGEAGYAKPRAVMREHNLDEFPDVYFSDPSGRVRLADMTGDGLNDIILLHNGRVDYWPNLGYGRFGKRITMTQSPRLEYNFDPKRLFLADLDGSGCADLVYVDTGKVHFWFNQSGNGWSEEQVINGTPPVTDFDSVQFSDIFGTGTATLVWSYDYGRYPGENYKALDLCGGKKPYVLSEMSNNMGATTRVQYAPSTRFYLEDKENGMPWVTNLPFPVHVVEKVEAIDHISKTKLVTTYKYHHGYYDGREREFRGFGRVDQFDTETVDDFTSPGLHGDDQLFTNNDQAFHVPPVETRSWFHTGVYFNEDKLGKDGKPFDHHKLMEAYKQEFYAKDAKAFPMEDQLFKSHTSRDDMEAPHEIFRALRGAMLRTEVYARDGSEKEPHPYVVTQNRYLITKIQPKGENRHAVYLTTPKESLSYHYERNPDDPRVGHDITLAVDVFGNVTDKISIGYPRRVPNDLTEQGELKILYSKADFINKTDASDFYYIGVPYQSLAFEVTGYEWDWETSQKFPATDFDDIMVNTAHPLEKWNVQPYEWKRPDGHAGVEKRLVEWTRSYFKNEGNNEEYLEIINPPGSVEHRLDLGKITRLGLPYETYQAVFTSIDSLKKQLEDGKDTDENRFRIKFGIDSDLLIEGGYHQDQDVAGYWWIPSGRQNFNKDNFYLPEKAQDPFGNLSTIEHDRYGLLMTKAVDPLGNTIEAKNNYRVLQPYAVTDPNQNFSVVRFDELGFVVKTALRGQNPDETWEGDYLNPEESEIQTDDDPTTRLEYDLFQWSGSNRPNYVKTLARERHQDDTTPWQESFLYSDGFGREVQTKVQAEPGKVHGMHCDKRWVGTGRKIYNNKGKPVKQYEPFFSSTHEYEDEALVVETGVTPVLFYDPLERVICTVHPNHTYKKVVFDPWKQETWDVNDTVYPLEKFDTVHFDPANPVYPDHVFNPADDTDIGNYISALPPKDYLPTWYDLRMDASKALEKWPDTERNEEKERNERIRISEKSAAQKAAKHCATPTITHLDSLGRPFLTIANNGFKSDGTDHLIKTRVKLDIEGNDLTITDPRNIIAFQHQFDIAGRTIFVNSVDAGRSAMVTDISGNPIRTQDANGNWMSITYDELRRPTETIVHRTRPYNDTITSQVMIYGETLNEETAIKNNQRGQLYAIFDGAGAVFNLSYDFKGNLEQSIRRLTITYKADEIDWKDISDIDFAKPLFELESKLEPLLAKETFFTSTSYDALNRVTESTTP
ncbi:MAG: FG-GAP-like repeat-containing protein, partial [Deltaproteobacteria bacterium]|nr:FG-GAP-like repeat-containing protein [Deltaproteobacteria bacterium]